MKKHEVIALCITLLFYLSVFLISLNKATNNVYTNYTSINISLETVKKSNSGVAIEAKESNSGVAVEAKKSNSGVAVEAKKSNSGVAVEAPKNVPEQAIIAKEYNPEEIVDSVAQISPVEQAIEKKAPSQLEEAKTPERDKVISTQIESTAPSQLEGTLVPNSSYSGNQHSQAKLPTIQQIIQKEIQKNLEYPEIAKKRSIQGNVIIKITVSPNGELISSQIVKTSGSSILDNAAEKLINKIFPLSTNEFLEIKKSITENITITYRLTSNT